MNTKTKTKVGRPAAQLIYPEGVFTIKQLHALNRRKVRWELSIRQHVERNIAKKLILKDRSVVHTGNVGKPAYLFKVSAKGLTKLNVKPSTPATIPVVDIPATVTPLPTPVETTPAALVVDATPTAVNPVNPVI